MRYARMGWPVYPVQPPNGKGCSCSKGAKCDSPGKHPYHALGGMQSASIDPSQLKDIFSNNEANLGLLCGSFLVLDVDGPQGIKDLAAMEEEHGPLPRTPTAATGGGGMHFLFKADHRVKSRTKIGGLSIDTKAGATSAIVAPPSRHMSGNTYRWLVSPEAVETAVAPEWLIRFVTGERTQSGTIFTVPEPSDFATHPGASEGERNGTLCRLVGSHLARYGETDDLIRLASEWGEKCDPPFGRRETERTVVALTAKHRAGGADTIRKGETLELDVTPFNEIEAKAVNWTWERRIASGKITLLTGDGGVGKSIFTCYVASQISRGEPFCDGSCCPLGDVFFVTGEDGAADTIRPRLDAAGADVARVHLVKGPIPRGQKFAMSVDLSLHINMLDRMLEEYPNAKLIVIDPIMDFLGAATNSDKATDVRQVLSPLRELAETHDVGILAINHLNKGGRSPKNRSLGSGAFVHVARIELRVCEDPEDAERRFLLPVKNNLAAADGLAYRIEGNSEGAGFAVWEKEPVDVSINDIEGEGGVERSSLEEAMEWLRGALADGRAKSRELLSQARRDGVAEITLRRAGKNLGIKPYSDDRAWWWELPAAKTDDDTVTDGEQPPEAESFAF
ncbi:DNA repair protein RadA [Novipirellula artificiosorum]|uniref:DNA repair protein RadA n=2 Tax=Novipirellula artificiosorum TaxID=2528016 RepID=A0A5C6DFQ7_9BACT|nr:DNA repair protein RadA [Novipirellula artificiosorum]